MASCWSFDRGPPLGSRPVVECALAGLDVGLWLSSVPCLLLASVALSPILEPPLILSDAVHVQVSGYECVWSPAVGVPAT